MNCMHCKSNLTWGGDHTYEDYGMDGDGIVSKLTCPNDNCGVETVLVYCSLDNKNHSELSDAEVMLFPEEEE